MLQLDDLIILTTLFNLFNIFHATMISYFFIKCALSVTFFMKSKVWPTLREFPDISFVLYDEMYPFGGVHDGMDAADAGEL